MRYLIRIQNIWLVPMLLIASCSRDPQSIDIGHDACAQCKMIISDRRFGAELITTKGKIYKFDSIECLANYVQNKETSDHHDLWVINYNKPERWIDATKATYLQSEKISSPMGKNLSAFENNKEAERIRNEVTTGTLLNWTEITHMIKDNMP